VPSDLFVFTGHEPEYGYLRYGDADSGTMLVAQPGGTYRIRPCEEGLPVPPDDGRWAAPATAAGRVAKARAALTASLTDTGETAPASAAGGEN
jgi:hypothetical protein